MSDKIVTEHPSFGVIKFTRVSGKTHLFDSDIDHYNFIRLEINDAKLIRDTGLHYDSVYSTVKSHLQIEMTELQFAKLLTSMNNGTGVPCTYRYKDGAEIPKPPFHEKKINNYEKELTDRGHGVVKKLQELENSVRALATDKGKANKADLWNITSKIQGSISDLTNNLPFLMKEYHEAMDQIAEDYEASAKGKIMQIIRDAGVENIINNRGALGTEAHPVLKLDSDEFKLGKENV